jgi:hypothetical protein
MITAEQVPLIRGDSSLCGWTHTVRCPEGAVCCLRRYDRDTALRLTSYVQHHNIIIVNQMEEILFIASHLHMRMQMSHATSISTSCFNMVVVVECGVIMVTPNVTPFISGVIVSTRFVENSVSTGETV